MEIEVRSIAGIGFDWKVVKIEVRSIYFDWRLMFPQGAMHTFNISKYPQSSHILQRYIVANANVGHSEGVVGREVGT